MHSMPIKATLVLLACLTSSLQAAEPQLREMLPQGAKRGSEVEVTLRGPRIGIDPQEILWHEGEFQVQSIERISDNQTKLKLVIPESTQPGRYGMRLRTASGISNVVTFHVGSLPEISEAEPNSNPLEPQSIDLGVVINGVVKQEDIDCFSFQAKAGQPIAVEVEGLRLGRTFFDPVITLFDKEGQPLAKCDDWPLVRQDACLSVIAPYDGKYLLELRESAYRGDDRASYRLHVGSFPRPLAVYPPGGRAGEMVTVNWIGDASGEASAQVELPNAPTENFAYVPFNDRGYAPSPHMLRVVDAPIVADLEPNGRPREANRGEFPGVYHGVLSATGDRDHFRFAAKKGQVLHMHLHARAIGSPVDGVLRILDANGKYLASNDDNRGYPDSYIRFQAPADSEYIAQIEDRLLRGGETFVYWLEAKNPTPIVNVQFDEQQRYVAKLFSIPQGNRDGAVMRVGRQDMGGELTFDWHNLPAGVSAEIFPLAGSYDRAAVVFAATDNAPLGQSLPALSATRTEDDKPVEANFSQVNWMVRGQNNVDMWSYKSERAVVAVAEEAPYRLHIEQPQAPLVQRGSMNLRVIAEREEGFDEAILVRMLYNPPGVSSNNSRRIKQGETEAVIPITANANARVGDWKIVVRGEADVGGRLVTVTPFATLSLREPYVSMEFASPRVDQGNSVALPITIQQHATFEGEAKVELMGLPAGATAEPLTISSDSTELTFNIKITNTARPGRHRGLFCRVTVTENGVPVVHSVGDGELRIDKPLPRSETTQASR